MRKILFFTLEVLLITISQPVSAQFVAKSYDSLLVNFDSIEMPQFRGGETGLRNYIAKNVRYPNKAKWKNIQGTVYVSFVVDVFGQVCRVEVLRGVHPLLDKEAVRVVRSLPKWHPGKKDGKPINVSHSVPIKFYLRE